MAAIGMMKLLPGSPIQIGRPMRHFSMAASLRTGNGLHCLGASASAFFAVSRFPYRRQRFKRSDRQMTA